MTELCAIEGKCVKCHRVWNLALLHELNDYDPGKCPLCGGKLNPIGYVRGDVEDA